VAALVVRTSILSIFFLAILMNVSGQSALNLQKRISIPANAIQLDSLLRVITRQSGAKFSINTRKFPASKSIAIKDQTLTIAKLMQVIKQTTGVYYATLGDHIILLDNPPPAKKNPTSVVNKQPVPVHKNTSLKIKPTAPVKKATAIITAPSSLRSKPVTGSDSLIKPDTASLKPKPDTTLTQSLPVAQPPARKKPASPTNKPMPPANDDKERSGFLSNLFVKAGVSADDLFYCNPTIQTGHPYLYGIVSYSTNFNLSGFRYGLGASVPLSDYWKLHLQLTTGNLSSKVDTFTLHWEYKTQLHRAGLIAETDLSRRFKLQFGPIFNLMKLTFYRNGQKTAPGLPTEYIDRKFNLLKPVYTFTNTFSPSVAKSTKSWVGLQISIFYNFNFFKQE
jgi:hypothetical protein